MQENSRRSLLLLERLLPWLVLGLLLLYTYAYWGVVPYAGFLYRPDGQVVELYVQPEPPADLRLNDRLLQVGPVFWDDFRQNFRQPLFEDAKPGDKIPLMIQRDNQTLTLFWVFPGRNPQEVVQRLINVWPLAYFFWLAGTIVALTIRPRDTRWRLLILFYYLTSLWLITGSGAGAAHVWEAGLVLQSAVWLSVPVYWHLHWVFPHPLRPTPRWLWGIVYGVAASLAVAPWRGWFPHRLYVYGFPLAIGGAVLVLVIHFLSQPQHRRDIGLLVSLTTLAVAPFVAISLAALVGLNFPHYAAGGTLLVLPLLPIGYFYAAYRRQLGGMELRRNRLLALYLFIVVLGTVLLLVYTLASVWWGLSSNTVFIGLVFSLGTAVVVILAYAPFQRLVERHLLGIPPAPTHLLETYAARIATRLDMPSLVGILRDEILPSLLVRQSALFHLDEAQRVRMLYQTGVSDSESLAERDVLALSVEVKQDWPRLLTRDTQWSRSYAWVRLALPLRLGDQVIGLWLFGRRDPDDEYAPTEVAVLQALADQTGMALAHVIQSEQLRVAYKADIDRMESERASLARELHDHVLGDLAELKANVEASSSESAFTEIYQRVITHLRQTITGLRPLMLNYGVRAALSSLVDALTDRAQNNLVIELNLPETAIRYEANLEQHLYRIVQQACENVLRHAQAQRLSISGQMDSDRIDLTIDDDGIGFETSGALDLTELIARRHFGLAGMHERATLIQAKLLIGSAPQQGTRVRIVWSPHDP
ncbi:two-component system, NarL family, sensor histidine kinase ComP [Anaerolineae bacterium]|nr:two-component system, NarL family, sensor histidine kinase ComP [Anaerolineae bacterium]